VIAPDPTVLPIRAQVLALRAGVEANLRAPVAPPAPSEQAAPRLPWQPGERLQAQVEASLPGGRFLLRIDQFAFDVQLPGAVRVGDKLQLEYAGALPRPQFVLARDEPPAQTNSAPRPELSPEGRALAALVQHPMEAGEETAPLRAAAPLLPQPPHEAAPLVAALKSTLEESGLFYESHLAEWVEGHRPLASILREPQARSPLAPNPGIPGTAITAQDESPPPPLLGSSAPSPATATADEPEGAPLNLQAVPVVRGQLEALETGQILWTGQLWPGQHLEWRLQEVHDQARKAEDRTPWSTQLRLTLPRLGSITADLQLTGRSLRLELAAVDAGTRQELVSARTALAKSLAEAGLQLSGFVTVNEHD
jgi:hypothetical protein